MCKRPKENQINALPASKPSHHKIILGKFPQRCTGSCWDLSPSLGFYATYWTHSWCVWTAPDRKQNGQCWTNRRVPQYKGTSTGAGRSSGTERSDTRRWAASIPHALKSQTCCSWNSCSSARNWWTIRRGSCYCRIWTGVVSPVCRWTGSPRKGWTCSDASRGGTEPPAAPHHLKIISMKMAINIIILQNVYLTGYRY